MLLKLSTATTVTIGPVLDADGVAVTTAVLADFSIAKNGSVATLTGATVTHSTNGYYLIALTVSNTNSLGRLDIIVNNSAMSMSNHRYDVLPSDTYEELMTTGIADAVWDEPYAGHTTAGSFGKLIDLLRKANMVVEGTVLASPTPTTTTFNVSGLNYPTGAFEHAVLFFADDATLAEQNSPILTFVNNGNGTQTIVLEEARTAAPIAGDTIFIDATSHVHAIVDIQAGLATSNGVTAAFTEIKGAGWSSGTDTLEEIADAIAAINVGGGTGARTVNVTVNDGTNALQNAIVRMTLNAETYVQTTNSSGQCTFNLDDGTWTVSISKSGYSFAGTTLVVNGTETATYSMSLVVITPSSGNKVTGYWTVLDENGAAAASVVITIKARQATRSSVGILHDAGERTATSNGSGLVQFANMIPGWSYAVVANDQYIADFLVPASAVTSVELGSVVVRLP
jgi:hypothetical protein